MTNLRIEIFASAASSRVDASAGLLEGVSVITEGEARGHNLQIDHTTLEQVMARADEFSGGVRVKINHKTGFESLVGKLTNFRIEGKQLKADLSLIKSHEQFDAIIELAESQPETFGLSISFSGKPEKVDGVKFARCTELYSVDLVDRPAANPSGLFSAVDSQSLSNDMFDIKELASDFRTFLKKETVNAEQFDAFQAEAKKTATELGTAKAALIKAGEDLTAATKQADALKADLEKKTTELSTALEKATADLKAKDDEFALKIKTAEEKAKKIGALNAQQIIAELGQPPLSVKADDSKKEDAKTELTGRDRFLNAFTVENPNLGPKK